MKAHEKKAIKAMTADVRKHLEKGDNISVSVLNYGLELTKPVVKALIAEGLPLEESSVQYSFMGYLTFRKPKVEKKEGGL